MAEATAPGAGRVVAGRYRLTGELGRGGMGVVWQADDELIGRQVAIKELRAPEGLEPAEHEVFAERALSEARNAARVRHPGAVTLYDVIPAAHGDDAIYLVMELIRAQTLSQLLSRDGPLDAPRAARIGAQVLDVLDAAHALGVVHRDVKPANIMIEPGDRVRLADFGIARGLDDPKLTRSGVMGTQAYMAPELFDAGPLTPAVDLWSLGATLYRTIAGAGPFDRQSTAATLRAILFDNLPAPPCGPPLSTAITGLLVRDPARRATSQQVRPLLRQAASMPSAPVPRPAPGMPPPVPRPTTSAPPPGTVPPVPRPATSAPPPGTVPPVPRPATSAPPPGTVPSVPRPATNAPAAPGTAPPRPPQGWLPPSPRPPGSAPPHPAQPSGPVSPWGPVPRSGPTPPSAWDVARPGGTAPGPSWTQPAAPPGTSRFAKKPRIFPGFLLPVPPVVVFFILLAVGAVVAFVLTALIAVASPTIGGFFFLVALALTLVTAIACMAMMSRWWTLQFSVLGMISCTAKKRRGVKRRIFILWRDIAWIGPFTQEHFNYLGVRSIGINGDTGLPVPVCPLATSDFPVAALREAILRYHPAANLDPQLPRS